MEFLESYLALRYSQESPSPERQLGVTVVGQILLRLSDGQQTNLRTHVWMGTF